MTARCPVCGSACGPSFLHRDRVSVHQNLLVDDRASARLLGNGTLDVCACHVCGFVFNAAFELERLRYGAAYDNTQTSSPAFERYVEGSRRPPDGAGRVGRAADHRDWLRQR